jgi:hypothetical protein
MPEEQKDNSKTPAKEANWQFHAEESQQAASQPLATSKPINPHEWTASEFIQHDKSAAWYMILALGAALLAAAVYLLTKDKISAGMIIIIAIVFGVFAARKPRELTYQVDKTGVHIGGKAYPYGNFKSFAVVEEGALESVWLMPLKRFMPIISIYFPAEDKDKIIDVVGAYLPVQEHQLDSVDKLMHHLRF